MSYILLQTHYHILPITNNSLKHKHHIDKHRQTLHKEKEKISLKRTWFSKHLLFQNLSNSLQHIFLTSITIYDTLLMLKNKGITCIELEIDLFLQKREIYANQGIYTAVCSTVYVLKGLHGQDRG